MATDQQGARYSRASASMQGREEAPELPYDASRCQDCGRGVSADWRRVMGISTSVGNVAYACPRCTELAAIQAGAARDPEFPYDSDTDESAGSVALAAKEGSR